MRRPSVGLFGFSNGLGSFSRFTFGVFLFLGSNFSLLLVLLQLLLHVCNGIRVKLSLNLVGGVNDVEILEEFIKIHHRQFEIIHAHIPIIIKIESHPSSLDVDLDGRVGLVHVLRDAFLLLGDHLDVAGDLFRVVIVKEEHVLHEGPQAAVELGEKLLSMHFHDCEFVIKLDHGVNSLVEGERLDGLHSLLAVEDTDV